MSVKANKNSKNRVDNIWLLITFYNRKKVNNKVKVLRYKNIIHRLYFNEGWYRQARVNKRKKEKKFMNNLMSIIMT